MIEGSLEGVEAARKGGGLEVVSRNMGAQWKSGGDGAARRVRHHIACLADLLSQGIDGEDGEDAASVIAEEVVLP